MIFNKWLHGEYNFGIPPLPSHWIGRLGCNLVKLTFDPAIGEEVCVLFREDPSNSEKFALEQPINIFAHTGIVSSPHGGVAFIVWQIAAGSPLEVFIETFLNPANAGPLLAQAAEQTHLKLLFVNNLTSEVAAMVDYENVFALGELVDSMDLVEAPADARDFERAVDHVLTNVDLVGAVRNGALEADQGECEEPVEMWSVTLDKRDLVEAIGVARTRATLRRRGPAFEDDVTLVGCAEGLSVRSSFAAMDIPADGMWHSPIMANGAAIRRLADKLEGPRISLRFENGRLSLNTTEIPAREL